MTGRARENVSGRLYDIDVTIPVGSLLSNEAFLGDCSLVGLLTDSNTDTATVFSFQAGAVSGSLFNMYSGGSELSYAKAASSAIPINPTDFAAFKYLKVRAGLSSSTDTLTAAMTVTLLLHPL